MPAARAGQVPGHLLRGPRRVLPGPGGRAEGPGRRRAADPLGRRPAPQRGAAGHRRSGCASSWTASPTSSCDSVTPALADAGIRLAEWSSLDEDDQQVPGRRRSTARSSRCSPRCRSTPATPSPTSRTCRSTSSCGSVTPSPASERVSRVKVPPLLSRFVRHARRRALRRPGADHRRAPVDVVPRHGDRRALRLPGDPQHRPVARGGRGRRPAGRRRDGAAPAPLRTGRAPRGGGRHDRRHPRHAAPRARPRARGPLRERRARSTSAGCGASTGSTVPTSTRRRGRR